jgi:hypothetical protein
VFSSKGEGRGKDFRFGCVRRINHYDLVVWVRLYRAQPAMIELGSKT